MRTVTDVQSAFAENLRLVQQLIDFDHVVLDTAITNMARLQQELDSRNAHAADRIGNTVQVLRNLRANDSMRRHYSAIYNQCLVLIVSHFSSACGTCSSRRFLPASGPLMPEIPPRRN